MSEDSRLQRLAEVNAELRARCQEAQNTTRQLRVHISMQQGRLARRQQMLNEQRAAFLQQLLLMQEQVQQSRAQDRRGRQDRAPSAVGADMQLFNWNDGEVDREEMAEERKRMEQQVNEMRERYERMAEQAEQRRREDVAELRRLLQQEELRHTDELQQVQREAMQDVTCAITTMPPSHLPGSTGFDVAVQTEDPELSPAASQEQPPEEPRTPVGDGEEPTEEASPTVTSPSPAAPPPQTRPQTTRRAVSTRPQLQEGPPPRRQEPTQEGHHAPAPFAGELPSGGAHGRERPDPEEEEEDAPPTARSQRSAVSRASAPTPAGDHLPAKAPTPSEAGDLPKAESPVASPLPLPPGAKAGMARQLSAARTRPSAPAEGGSGKQSRQQPAVPSPASVPAPSPAAEAAPVPPQGDEGAGDGDLSAADGSGVLSAAGEPSPSAKGAKGGRRRSRSGNRRRSGSFTKGATTGAGGKGKTTPPRRLSTSSAGGAPKRPPSQSPATAKIPSRQRQSVDDTAAEYEAGDDAGTAAAGDARGRRSSLQPVVRPSSAGAGDNAEAAALRVEVAHLRGELSTKDQVLAVALTDLEALREQCCNQPTAAELLASQQMRERLRLYEDLRANYAETTREVSVLREEVLGALSSVGRVARRPSGPEARRSSGGAAAPYNEGSFSEVERLRKEIAFKDKLLRERRGECDRLNNEIERWYSAFGSRHTPFTCNMAMLDRLQAVVEAAELAEEMYRVSGWNLLALGCTFQGRLRGAHADLSEELPLLVADPTTTRRLQRAAEAVDHHFAVQMAAQRRERARLKELSNRNWDRVLYYARTLVHPNAPEPVGGIFTPATTQFPGPPPRPFSAQPVRPSSAPGAGGRAGLAGSPSPAPWIASEAEAMSPHAGLPQGWPQPPASPGGALVQPVMRPASAPANRRLQTPTGRRGPPAAAGASAARHLGGPGAELTTVMAQRKQPRFRPWELADMDRGRRREELLSLLYHDRRAAAERRLAQAQQAPPEEMFRDAARIFRLVGCKEPAPLPPAS
eukprot:TRINITY_DN746_c0_g3_i1.p1 TRINITY_DN746_c0_g3~~TRINITY_DN746_c0_g3_i1.p1  ORF type:complete len:1194 (+),score=358.80 TRINITY_DN746_c0_g3_i1:498-3584(+)